MVMQNFECNELEYAMFYWILINGVRLSRKLFECKEKLKNMTDKGINDDKSRSKKRPTHTHTQTMNFEKNIVNQALNEWR